MAALLAALVVLYLGAVSTATGQRLDAAGFAVAAHAGGRWQPAYAALRDRLPWLLAAATLVLSGVAIFRRRWRDLIGAALVVTLASPLTHVLRLVLPRPMLGDNGYEYNTFPSGHTALVGSLLFAAYALAPRRFRGPRLGAICAVLTAVAGTASVMSYAHRPSDVIGALLVVAMSVVFAVAATANDVLPVWPGSVGAAWAVAIAVAIVSGWWWGVSGWSAAAILSYTGTVVALSFLVFGEPDRRSRARSS